MVESRIDPVKRKRISNNVSAVLEKYICTYLNKISINSVMFVLCLFVCLFV